MAGSAVQAAEVVALGASNTYGRGRGSTPDGVNPAQAYPAQLERMLQSQGCRVRVLNAGIAGNTTGQMLARLVEGLSQDGQKGRPSDFVSAEQGDCTQWVTFGICPLSSVW